MHHPLLMMRVHRIADEAQDIRSFELVDESGRPLPGFTAGAHIDLHLGPGLIRQYSLCNGPEQSDSYTIAVKREAQSRGGSSAMHDRLRVGDRIGVTGPRNNFPLAADAREHLLLAGGIGVTPLLSMARYLRATGKPFRLEYFTRSASHTAFGELLSGPEFADRVTLHHGVEPAEMAAYLQERLAWRPDGRHVYACGPRPFMQLVEQTAAQSYPTDVVHLEHFQADPSLDSAPRDRFTIRLARSGREMEVPEGESVVDVLTRHGVRVEVMCQQGICGTCLTGVVEGVPDHRDAFLSEAERGANDKMLLCCSRARTQLLVLDL
ncbi:Vanillate O-demethylase oxidoreductase [Cupriavidus taiwanensis]|uniref:Vanillate O-demethylase oxidoreductase n=1 Tax=Cupriavidus taiwanensis TaxID=164546 RepID=A0A375C7T1_9BURK|nr:PDR/VanB family oxidoreductase [Cupriavidus taiwanensis]SOY64338.1 Vanillate O-demethylase oxidoreductase [Cupriavidus taiwanensis]